MSLLKEELVTINGNKAKLSQVGGVINSRYTKNLNFNQIISLLAMPAAKYDLQHRLKRKGKKRITRRKFRKRRRGGRKTRGKK